LQTITPSDLTVSSAKIQTSAVTTAKIADANITAAKLDGAQSGSAPIYAARAWVNFNGTGTVAIRASGNVSSITDNGTGDYTVNFTTAMSDANYSINLTTATTFGRTLQVDASSDTAAPTTQSTTAVRITIKSTSSNVGVDMANIYAAIFR
jgi:hypothetical protein